MLFVILFFVCLLLFIFSFGLFGGLFICFLWVSPLLSQLVSSVGVAKEQV